MDVWSFAVITWEILRRVKPYKGLIMRQVSEGLDSEFGPKRLFLLFFATKPTRFILILLVKT